MLFERPEIKDLTSSEQFKYYIKIGDEEKEVLLHLNMLQMPENKKIIQYTNLVSALFIFSIAFYSYSIHISFAWIFMVLSIGLAVIGLCVGKFQRAFFKAFIKREVNQKNNNERAYLFSKEGVDITTELGTTHNYWSSFVSRGEIDHYIYLMRKDRNIILIDKNELPQDNFIILQRLIQNIEIDQLLVENQIEKEDKTPFGIKLLSGITVIAVIVSLIYMGIRIGYPLSQGQIFRLWFTRTVPIILLLILQCLDFIWTCVLSRIIKVNKKKSLLKRILLWVAGIIVVLAMALGILVHMLNDDSEHYNEDGTVIIESPVWLDKPEFKLYQEENFLVLRYLRDADGLEDIDPSISQDEYLSKKQDELEKKMNHSNVDKQEQIQEKAMDQDAQESEKNRSIEEGYQKIYDTYIKDTDTEYRKDYNAKGYGYIITYEDEKQIRYLMYDRDDNEGEKAQYVYYKNEKKSDGSWSPMDSEILDMYQYDYELKEVADLEKTSW